MKINWHPKAVEEFLELDTEVQKFLNQEIEKLPDKNLDWGKVERVKRDKIGLDAYRLKLDPKEKKEINHRIIFKVTEKSYLILKIGKRPDFYNLENLEEAKDRI